MIGAGISTAQLVSLIAASLMLMLVGRNVAALRVSRPRLVTFGLIWLVVFCVAAVIASLIGG